VYLDIVAEGTPPSNFSPMCLMFGSFEDLSLFLSVSLFYVYSSHPVIAVWTSFYFGFTLRIFVFFSDSCEESHIFYLILCLYYDIGFLALVWYTTRG